jgi:undecaprenyl-diphosphatase
MEEWLKVVILGVVEGVTEYLPISSTGHLIVTSRMLELKESLKGTFEIFIQIGAVVAVLFYYRTELLSQARSARKDSNVQHLWLAIALAFVPAAAIGFLFNDWIDEVLFNPVNVALALIVGGVMFIGIELYQRRRPQEETPTELEEAVQHISFRQALLIGCWQVLALFPGMSRSGMSILGGMIAGLPRTVATQFSFYLAIPTLGIATSYTLLKKFNTIGADDMFYLLLGAAVSAVVSWLAIAWLLRFIATHTFIAFGVYRILIGAVILALFL